MLLSQSGRESSLTGWGVLVDGETGSCTSFTAVGAIDRTQSGISAGTTSERSLTAVSADCSGALELAPVFSSDPENQPASRIHSGIESPGVSAGLFNISG